MCVCVCVYFIKIRMTIKTSVRVDLSLTRILTQGTRKTKISRVRRSMKRKKNEVTAEHHQQVLLFSF